MPDSFWLQLALSGNGAYLWASPTATPPRCKQSWDAASLLKALPALG